MGQSAACNLERVSSGIDHSGLFPCVYVVRCRHCGVGFTEPPLADVAFLYAGRSSQDFQPNTRGLVRIIKKVVFRLQARHLVGQIGTQPATVIDFGCGSGLFSNLLAAILPASVRIIACDFHSEPPAELGAVEYRSLKDLGDLYETADLVLAMHVIEHDNDPRTLLADITRLVKSGGKIVVEVPNINCIWATVFGRWWDPWYLPYHRTHFSRDSLYALIESSGLEIVTKANISLPSMGRSMANLTHRHNGLAFIIVSAVLQPLQWLLERFTDRPTALRVIARKT
jgi:2-polyprenyl-3-methyl-5-hydroxy-6-metoxy-1,4-benzoquinol methylase